METKRRGRPRKTAAKVEQSMAPPKTERKPIVFIIGALTGVIVYLVRGQGENVIMGAVQGLISLLTIFVVKYLGNGKPKQNGG